MRRVLSHLVGSAALLALWALVALLTYWWGRVLFPAAGLSAPDYMTWFWAILPVMLLGAVSYVIKEVVS